MYCLYLFPVSGKICLLHYSLAMPNHIYFSIGPPNCTVSVTASKVTAESAVISWSVHSCFGTVPTSYNLYWCPVEGLLTGNWTLLNSSTINQYKITGLSPRTRYFIVLYTFDFCGHASSRTALTETVSGEQEHITIPS